MWGVWVWCEKCGCGGVGVCGCVGVGVVGVGVVWVWCGLFIFRVLNVVSIAILFETPHRLALVLNVCLYTHISMCLYNCYCLYNVVTFSLNLILISMTFI